MRLKFSCAGLMSLCIISSVYAAEGIGGYHSPQTSAEKSLDKILRLNSDKEYDLYKIVFDYPNRNKKYEEEVRSLFTESFLQKSASWERELVKESCGNIVPADGEPCDVIRSVNPIICAQDALSTYLYKTIYQDASTAIIRYGWPEGSARYADGPVYTFYLREGVWKLGKASCENMRN